MKKLVNFTIDIELYRNLKTKLATENKTLVSFLTEKINEYLGVKDGTKNK